jgi:beclin 1
MANDKKQPGLACQKCRTPIDIDASIDQLNPAAFKLLIGTIYLVETFAHDADM